MSAVGNQQWALKNQLCKLFTKAKMPSSPALAAQILTLIKDSKSNASDFGAVIRTDPGLVARLLKTANSAQFAQREPVTTCERAIMVLGMNRVKTISLGFQLVGHLDRLGGAPFDMKRFWQHSLLRACLARAIAQNVVPDHEEEAFLAGLLLDCGILLLVQTLGCGYASLYPSNLSPAAFYAVERETFPHTHVDAISVMASEWNLPKIIAVPLERHHERTPLGEEASEVDRLAAVSHFVGSLCFAGDRSMDREAESLREFGETVLGLDESVWSHVRDRAGVEYGQVSTLYGEVLPEDIDVADLLLEANDQLARVATDADRRVINIEAERNSIQQEQSRLANALREYRERAAMDPLTNVLNRGGLTDAARKAIGRNRDEGVSVGVFFIDLDNFKKLNDVYGHKVGDTVLKATAAVLDREIGPSGIVGRYGGEEFVALIQGLSADANRELAEHVVQQVRSIDTNAVGCSGNISCSLGAIWYDRVPVNSADELFAAADELMYKAKRGGKDCCCFDQHEAADSGGQRDDRDISASQDGRVRRADQSSGGPHGGSYGLRPVPGQAGVRKVAGPRIEELIGIAKGLNAVEMDPFAGIRKQERKNVVMPCVVHYFPEFGTKTCSEPAVSRNLSTGGIGLLLTRAMARGEAVEVMLDKGTSKFFLAGMVAFCRQIEGTIHEVGVQFVAHSVKPIISGDISKALQRHDWVAQAVDAKRKGKLEPQVTS